MSECIFCQILSGSIPATFVQRDEVCAAFMDIQPVNAGHVLVIPVQHATHLADLDGATLGHMARAAQTVAAALRHSGVPCEGVDLFLADGAAAGQEVFHVHLHVIPRYAGDGVGFKFGPHYHDKPARAELEAAAAQIRTALSEK